MLFLVWTQKEFRIIIYYIKMSKTEKRLVNITHGLITKKKECFLNQNLQKNSKSILF